MTASATELKRRIVTSFAKHATNRVYRSVFRLGFAPPGTALLQTTRRRSGEPRQTPAANGLDGPARNPRLVLRDEVDREDLRGRRGS